MQALRIARPTDRLEAVTEFYRDGLGLEVLSRFEDHAGFSGRILGRSDLAWHLEFVHEDGVTYGPAPDPEHLLAIYHDDEDDYDEAVARLVAAGAGPTTHPNPWWNDHGSCWLDPDGYVVALVRTPWHRSAVSATYDRYARYYDALYRALGKDYDGEAAAVLAIGDDEGVSVGSLLDVACGTGLHLERFAASVGDVAGVDVAPGMLAVAAERLGSAVPLVRADFRALALGRRFDVVTCMFSAIGHVADAEELDTAVAAMAAHVAPGGMLVIEPWLTPDQTVPGGIRQVLTAHVDDDVVARVSRSWRDGDALVVEFGFTVASPHAITHEVDRHRMPLFTRQRYEQALAAAGLEASWREDPPWLRGLLVGRRTETST